MKKDFSWTYSAFYCLGVIALVVGGAWSTIFILGAVQFMEDSALALYHVGSGLGGLAILALGLYGILGAPGKYESTVIKVEQAKLNAQRNERLRQKKVDHALDTVEAFERVKEAITRVRTDMTISSEMAELAELLPEDSDLRDPDNHLQNMGGLITLLKMQREYSVIKTLYDHRPRFRVLFKDTAPFQDMNKVWIDINIAASTIFRTSELSRQIQHAQEKGLDLVILAKNLQQSTKASEGKDRIIYSGLQSEDPIEARVAEIIKTVEKTCESVLSELKLANSE